MAFREGLADPTYLDGLREALAVSDPQGRLAMPRMRRIEVGPEILGLLPGAVSELMGLAESPAPGVL